MRPAKEIADNNDAGFEEGIKILQVLENIFKEFNQKSIDYELLHCQVITEMPLLLMRLKNISSRTLTCSDFEKIASK